MISEKPIERFKVDQLEVKIYQDRLALGAAAAAEAAIKMNEIMPNHRNLRMIFAAAPSQNEFLSNLIVNPDLSWERVEGFHMDEYIGLNNSSLQQSFGIFLKENLFEKVPFNAVHYLPAQTHDPQIACAEYAKLLGEEPIDIVALGIGENGHIAFNDPPVADFQDPELVKVVTLDDKSRQQQVNDGCFHHFIDVPEVAMTLTVPALFSGRHMFCMVPGATKADAVYETLRSPVNVSCPATILREHPQATLYLDLESASKL